MSNIDSDHVWFITFQKSISSFDFQIFHFFHRLQGLEEQYRKEKEEADQLFEQQRKVIW